MFNKKKRYIAVFLTTEQGTYSVLKRKFFKPSDKTVRYVVGKSYKVDVSRPTYTKGLKLFYFIDINPKKGQLFFKANKDNNENPELIDMILRQGIISQIAGSLGKSKNAGMMSLIFAFIFGAVVGFMIAGFI